jgi:hypothetical protein
MVSPGQAEIQAPLSREPSREVSDRRSPKGAAARFVRLRWLALASCLFAPP